MKAAREIVDEKGFESATMAEIAERANIVEGTVYRYFKNKDELLLRVAEEWFATHHADIVDVRSFTGTYNRLRYLIWHSLKTIKDGPALSRYVMTELRPRFDYKDTQLFQINRSYTEQIRELFHEAIETGEFEGGVSERLLRDMVFGTIEHSTWRFLRGEGDIDIDELANEIASVVYRGMTARSTADEQLQGVVHRLEKVTDRLQSLSDKRGG